MHTDTVLTMSISCSIGADISFSFIKDLSFGYIFRMTSVNERRQFVNN